MTLNPTFGKTKSSGFLSSFAMAIALAGGTVVASAAIAPAAYAQDYSKEFVEAYSPVADLANAETPDWAGARAGIPSVIAAIANEDDRFAAGQLITLIGQSSEDRQIMRQGLILQLASGKVPLEQMGQYNFYVGSFAFEADDWAAARPALQASIDAGYTEGNAFELILQSYFEEERTAEGIAVLASHANSLMAAGQPVPEKLLLVGLRNAYNYELVEEALIVSKLLVSGDPTTENWMQALQVIGVLSDVADQTQLDLYRLMRQTGALSQRAEYARYAEYADPRIMSNEILPLIEEGVAAGLFEANDEYFSDMRSIAQSRAAGDRRDLDGSVSDGRSGNATFALSTGDLLFSVEDYVRAEELYGLALEKGADRDTALTRMGIAQVRQGKFVDAIANFEQVTGGRGPIAQMWAAYAKVQMGV